MRSLCGVRTTMIDLHRARDGAMRRARRQRLARRKGKASALEMAGISAMVGANRRVLRRPRLHRRPLTVAARCGMAHRLSR